MATTKKESTHNDFLIRGTDYLAQHPDFELIGRAENMRQIAGILMRQNANNVLVSGPGGVGLTALALGLQASKDIDGTPFDIVGKRFFWLDTDNLFASGDPAKINEGFQRALKTLSRAPDTVLVVDDMKDFIEGCRNNGCTHLINALMSAVRSPDLQAFIEVREEDLDMVYKCHSDMREFFTLHDVNEPAGDALRQIIDKAAEGLSKHHGIVVSPDAVKTAIELTSKYRVRDPGLSRAQPERSVTLLDRALGSFRLEQHASPKSLRDLNERLKLVELGIEKERFTGELEGKSPAEADALRESLKSDIRQVSEDWDKLQDKLRVVYRDQRDGEEALRRYEDELEAQIEREEEARAAEKKMREEKGLPAAETPAQPEKAAGPAKFVGFGQRMADAGFESNEVREIRKQIKTAEAIVKENKDKFTAMTAEMNKDLILDDKTVLAEFSRISGIPADKLSQDEREKLLTLEDRLSSRVFGQENAVTRLTDAVIMSRMGKRRSDKPAAFMFIGPSGVGKTEIAKALAEALYDDEKALLQFDMSEYMEKHTVAKLIGAPPGYEGFEVGGILTNAMRQNPRRIILFDEVEKAHPDVFNIFLQILGDGHVSDNIGRKSYFGDSIILMTSNLGQHNFLDTSLTHAEQFEKTMTEMKDHGLRPEFLNRFNGRENIVPFNTLTPEVIQMIVGRELKKINASYAEDGIQLAMTPDALKEFVDAKYNPEVGARGLPGYINANVESKLARTVLMNPDVKGTIEVAYNKDTGGLDVTLPKAPDVANDVGKKPAAPGSASQAFKHS